MYVVKRDGRHEPVKFDKITARLAGLADGLSTEHCDITVVAQQVIQQLVCGIHTSKLDELAAEVAAYKATIHPDYGVLAGRIAVSNLHKHTRESIADVATLLFRATDPKNGRPTPMLNEDTYDVIMANRERLDAAIDFRRDFQLDFFGFKTLQRSYLMRVNGEIVERYQHMLMRVAIGIHGRDIDAALETYDLMSRGMFTHATPTLFNAGTCRPQCSSCFLVKMKDDSISGIYDTLKECAIISKYAGGIGLSIHNIRATGSFIAGTNGTSNGIVPMLRVFNDTARYVDQGGGKRKGSFAVYLEPWHPDIFEFLELKKNHGKEEARARDLFYAMWTPDLFMQRVEDDGQWSLFCPHEAPGLEDAWGEEFVRMYEQYEREGLATKTVRAQELWAAIIASQLETGTPYMLYKDQCNAKSNQQNLGTIHSSNLCTEIIQYTSEDETAVCNLASVALPKFVDLETRSMNYDELVRVVGVMTRNLNKIIDVNYYPVDEARRSNMRHRPIGIGVQGLADVFAMLKYPFTSSQARDINKNIFESVYYGALRASCDLAKEYGPYRSFAGSPASRGKLQFDLWGAHPSLRYDWPALKRDIHAYGLRNSLVTAPMPTASTAQILGNNEAFEPFTSNLYSRRTLSGDFICVNKHMVRDFVEAGIWNDDVRLQLLADNGSVQDIPGVPDHLREIYKTVWEIKQRELVDMAADRSPYIDQSQSLNIHLKDATAGKVTSMHFHGWKLGLKTGMYYLRTKPKAMPIQFTVDQTELRRLRDTASECGTSVAAVGSPASVHECDGSPHGRATPGSAPSASAAPSPASASMSPVLCPYRPGTRAGGGGGVGHGGVYDDDDDDGCLVCGS